MGNRAKMAPDLFPETLPPRRKPRVMMHVIDAGEVPGLGESVHMKCRRCGHDAGWLAMRCVSAEKRGRPCPKCNDLAGDGELTMGDC